MKEKNRKKIIVASALAVGAVAGIGALTANQPVSATDGASESSEQQTAERHTRPELSEEKKAEIKAKLESMTEEEKAAWKETHKKEKRDVSRREKPANMTDEEWEQKKAERKQKIKEKLESMTEEEKQAWLETHKKQKTSSEE